MVANFYGGHASTKEGDARQVSSMTRNGGGHHSCGIEVVLGKCGSSEGLELPTATVG